VDEYREILQSMRGEFLDAIREFKRDIEKMFLKLDTLNDKIISAEKDIEYMKLELDETEKSHKKDIDEMWKSYRNFKQNDLCLIIDTKIKSLKIWVLINAVSLLLTTCGFLTTLFLYYRGKL